jgi:hypothetical protein
MHGVCDYSAIHTSKPETGPHGSINNSILFTLGSNVVLTVHAILTFTVKVEDGPADIKILINNKEVATYKLSDYFGTINKIVGPDVLHHGTNQIHFSLVAEDYLYMYVEDIALWWFKNSLD